MTERLPDRSALRLEQLAGGAVALPRIRKLGETDLVKPGFPIAQQNAECGPRHGEPALFAFRYRRKDVVEAALLLRNFLGNVAHIHDAFGIQVWPIVHRMNEIGAAAGLDRCSDARL